jgi:hypothetical protein
MNNILEKHQKGKYRYKNKDIILYHPTSEQDEEIKQLVQGSIQIDKEMQVSGELSFKSVRYIIREITSIGHEIDNIEDKEIQEKLENGDRCLVLLKREIDLLIQEVVDDIFYDYTQQIKEMSSLLNIFNSNDDLNKLQTKFNKVMKKFKIDVKFEEFMGMQNNPQAIEDLTKKLNIKTK